MSESTEFIRTASKNERRYIMRHALGFYNALTLTGLYTIPHTDSLNANNLDKFIPALKHCIAVHPFLSTAIKGENTENPSFVRPASINLRNHLHLVDMLSNSTSSSLTDKDDRDLHLITQVTKKIHDEPFVNVDQQPPWKVLIVPLSDEAASGQRVYIIFACSHSHGDGKSGLEFHKTFLEGLKYAHELYDQGYLYQTSTSALPLLPPLEEAANLSITWRYLFLNLFGRHMPSIACRLLGLQPPANIIHGFNAWTGRAMTFDPSKFHTGSEALLVKKDLLSGILRVCREHGVKFTGFFNHLVAHILHSILLQHRDTGRNTCTRTLLGQIVVDLRALIPAYIKSENQMVNSVSALYVSSTRSSSLDQNCDNQSQK